MWFEVRTAVIPKEQSSSVRRYAVWQIGTDVSDISLGLPSEKKNIILKKETIYFSEMLVPTQQMTRLGIPAIINHYNRQSDNSKNILIVRDIRLNITYILPNSTEHSPSWEANRFSVKKFPTFNGTRRHFTTFASVRHLSLCWARSIQSMPPTSQFLKIHIDIILPYVFIKNQLDALFLKFILVKHSTCFGQICCPSSGV